jgi:transcriptional regulator with XRE-family HTH domain
MMHIGTKIKDLRASKMMTQQELAGDHITRNMLSRIENGFALPSLPSLLYISDRLGVPPGYLLASENEEFHYKKTGRIEDIISTFSSGEWMICKDLCLGLTDSDDEIRFVIFLCLLNQAKELFNAGDLREAADLFEQAKKFSVMTAYPTAPYVAECETYLLCIFSISPSLASDIEVSSSPNLSALSDSFCRYYSLIFWADNGDPVLFEKLREISFEGVDSVFSAHISAKAKIKKGDYLDAYHIMKQLLSNSENIPAPMLYFIFTDLELCCRELSDYRGAYEYSSDRTGMLEKFLG